MPLICSFWYLDSIREQLRHFPVPANEENGVSHGYLGRQLAICDRLLVRGRKYKNSSPDGYDHSFDNDDFSA